MEIKSWTKFQLVTDTIYGCMTLLSASGGRGGEWKLTGDLLLFQRSHCGFYAVEDSIGGCWDGGRDNVVIVSELHVNHYLLWNLHHPHLCCVRMLTNPPSHPQSPISEEWLQDAPGSSICHVFWDGGRLHHYAGACWLMLTWRTGRSFRPAPTTDVRERLHDPPGSGICHVFRHGGRLYRHLLLSSHC